jgi:O-antigen/teichoic acid export membrane protein
MATVAESHIRSQEPCNVAAPTALAGDSLAAGILFALVFTVGQRFIGFLRSVLFCRWMTDQELGQWSIVWGFLMLLPPLAMLGLPGCFGKFTEYYHQRGSVRSFIFRIVLVSGLTTSLGILSLFLFPSYFANVLLGDHQAVGMMICLAVTLVSVSLSNFAASLLESIRQVRLVSFMRFVIVAAFTLLGSLAILWFDRTVEAVTLAYGLSCLLSLFPAVWLLYRFRGEIFRGDATPCPRSDMWRRVVPFAAWLWLANLLNNSIEIVDRYMLMHCANVSIEVAQSYVGQYHSSRIVPALLISIAAMLGGILLPYLSKLWEAGKRDEAARQLNATFKALALVFTAGGITILMFSDVFFENILQGKYSGGLTVFPLTMVLCTWFSLYTVGQDYLWVAERGRYVSAILAIGLAVNVGSNFLSIPAWGLWGAVLSGTIANLLVLVLLLITNHVSGCPNDLGMWLCLALPLLMLISPIAAAMSFALILLLAVRTDWLFSNFEKEACRNLWEQLAGRILSR